MTALSDERLRELRREYDDEAVTPAIDELIASRRLAAVHEADAATYHAAECWAPYGATGDRPRVVRELLRAIHESRRVRSEALAARALEPQPDEPHYSELFGVGFTDDQCIAIRAFVRAALGGKTPGRRVR